MPQDPRIGNELAGYHVKSVLGRGGMSVVYLAEDPRLGRKVALKVLAPSPGYDERFRERFVRESRLAAALDHPNVIPIYEAGEADGLLFIAMRYVKGSDLETVIREEGPLELDRTGGIVSQVAAALDAAHSEGLVHRDVKPANVLLSRRTGSLDHAYLCDFGLTKRSEADRSLTRSGHFVGSVDYVAPEQIEGTTIDGRADVYSLGCLTYKCLTGSVPFASETDLGVLWAHRREPPPSPTELRSDLPSDADRVVHRAMAKSPDDRYSTAGEMAAELRRELHVTSEELRIVAPARRAAPWRAIALVTAGVIGLTGLFLVLGPSDEPGSPTESRTAQGDTGLRIDPLTAVTLPIEVGESPTDIGVGEGSVWVANFDDDTVSRIDPTRDRTITIDEVGDGPTSIDTGGGVPGVWVVDSSTVRMIDPGTNETARDAHIAECPPRSCTTAVAAGLGAVWVIHRDSAALYRVHPDTLAVDRVSLPEDPLDVAVGGGRVWVLTDTAKVLPITPSSNAVGRPIPLLGKEGFTTCLDASVPGSGVAEPCVALHADDDDVWVAVAAADRFSATVFGINPEAERVVHERRLPCCPQGLWVDDDELWFVTDRGELFHARTSGPVVQSGADELGRATAVAVGYGSVWVVTDQA
jgi:serine/threonine-protein kinase